MQDICNKGRIEGLFFLLDFDNCMAVNMGAKNANAYLKTKVNILRQCQAYVMDQNRLQVVGRQGVVRIVIVDDMEAGELLVNNELVSAIEELTAAHPEFIFDIIRYDPKSLLLDEYFPRESKVPILYGVSTVQVGASHHNEVAYRLANLEIQLEQLRDEKRQLLRQRERLFHQRSSTRGEYLGMLR